jgi:hypothetical protein
MFNAEGVTCCGEDVQPVLAGEELAGKPLCVRWRRNEIFCAGDNGNWRPTRYQCVVERVVIAMALKVLQVRNCKVQWDPQFWMCSDRENAFAAPLGALALAPATKLRWRCPECYAVERYMLEQKE